MFFVHVLVIVPDSVLNSQNDEIEHVFSCSLGRSLVFWLRPIWPGVCVFR